MRYSELFPKVVKEAPKGEVSINAKLLQQGGFIDKLMAGSYTLLPLGRLVERKIEQIIREEMNATGGEEVLMPLLHPKELWNETGRWDSAREVMYQFKKDEKEYALSFTHEEIVLDLVRKHVQSYKDFPVKIYHFSTKFRNELRPKSGILRGREFLMKDLYSLHVSKEDFEKYYEEVKEAYKKIFKRVGLDVVVTEAGGGVFTKNITHEFQVLAPSGEDEIIYCEGGDFAQNTEIAKVKEGKQCDVHKDQKLKKAKAIEVGNIFGFGQEYCKKMNVTYMDKDGRKEFPYFGSYGIGPTRVMGTVVEVHHDDKGIIWPESVAPFQVHLIALHSKTSELRKMADEAYQKLQDAGIEVLYDEREDASSGEKFATADLIGIPFRAVVAGNTNLDNYVEFKRRNEDKVELISLEEVVSRLQPIR